MAVDKRDLKQWAREHFRGYENCTIPSFTPDLAALDEEGIRRDVRQAKAHGFFSTLCAVETGLTMEEKKRFVEIAADEASGDISCGVSLTGHTLEENIELARHAASAGCTHGLLSFPQSFTPTSPAQIVEYASAILDSAEIGIYLFVSDKFGFHRLHPTGVPFDAFDVLADRDDVIGLKLGGFDSGTAIEVFERYGDRLLVCTLNPGLFPLMVLHYGQQWSGAWTVEALQTVEQPLAVDYFEALLQGRVDEAMELYWRMAPAIGSMVGLMGPLVPTGTYHWPRLKYYQWLSGGNGGTTRQPCMRVYKRDMEAIKNGFRATGLRITDDPDDAFFVGRTFAGGREKLAGATGDGR